MRVSAHTVEDDLDIFEGSKKRGGPGFEGWTLNQLQIKPIRSGATLLNGPASLETRSKTATRTSSLNDW